MANKHELTLGAIPKPGGVSFRVWAPRAADVSLILLSEPSTVFPLEREAEGSFSALVPEAAPGMDYLYRIDGKRERPDPASRHQPQGTRGPSRVVDSSTFPWSDTEWRGRALPEYILYALHIGTFTPEGTFDAAIEKLPYLRDLGITAVELMSVAAFSEERRSAYSGVALFAPHSRYGGPLGLARFVDACHRNGLCCVLDVQYDHLDPEWSCLADFAPYLTERYWTPWGGAVNFDGPLSDGVRRFFIENALYWLREYHVDALRVGAVQNLFDASPRHILDEIQAAFSAEAKRLGREAYLIADSDLNDLRVMVPRERGGHALDAQSSGGFHHAVHALLTRGTHGRRLGSLIPLEQQKLAACLLLLAPNIPQLFMGQEYGELAPLFEDALDWNALEHEPGSQLLLLYRELLALRHQHPCLRSCRQDLCRAMFSEAKRYLVLQRSDPSGSCALALFNLSEVARSIPTPDVNGRFRLALASADARYGGPAAPKRVLAAPEICPGWDLFVMCPAWSVLVYLQGA